MGVSCGRNVRGGASCYLHDRLTGFWTTSPASVCCGSCTGTAGVLVLVLVLALAMVLATVLAAAAELAAGVSGTAAGASEAIAGVGGMVVMRMRGGLGEARVVEAWSRAVAVHGRR